jgi:hypothetical protein
MKVLNYLELNCQTEYTEDYLTNWILVVIDKEFDGYVNKFYFQLFTHELITKYFEGWQNNKNWYGSGINDIYFYPQEESGKINSSYEISLTKRGQAITILEFWQPRTLDDFINDCQRAGIELKWKEVNNDTQ